MILIVAAMASEIREIINEPQDNIKIIQTGVGKVNASSGLSYELAKNTYDMIINIGIAGATKPFVPGDMVLIEKAKYHDFDLTMFDYAIGQVPGYPEYFLTDEKLKHWVYQSIPHIKTGTLYTGDRFMTGKTEDNMVFDMEGAALYHVAHQHQIPIISIKVISDIIGEQDHIQNYTRFEAEAGASKILSIYNRLKGDVSQ